MVYGVEVDDTANAGNGATGSTGLGVVEIDGNVTGHVSNSGVIADSGDETDAL